MATQYKYEKAITENSLSTINGTSLVGGGNFDLQERLEVGEGISIDGNTISSTIKSLIFKGFVSATEPQDSRIGNLWYVSEDSEMPTEFPIQVKMYDGTSWSEDTFEYTPEALDMWANRTDDHGYYWFGDHWNIIDVDLSNYYNKTESDNRYLRRNLPPMTLWTTIANGNYQQANWELDGATSYSFPRKDVNGELTAADPTTPLSLVNKRTLEEKLTNLEVANFKDGEIKSTFDAANPSESKLLNEKGLMHMLKDAEFPEYNGDSLMAYIDMAACTNGVFQVEDNMVIDDDVIVPKIKADDVNWLMATNPFKDGVKVNLWQFVEFFNGVTATIVGMNYDFPGEVTLLYVDEINHKGTYLLTYKFTYYNEYAEFSYKKIGGSESSIEVLDYTGKTKVVDGQTIPDLSIEDIQKMIPSATDAGKIYKVYWEYSSGGSTGNVALCGTAMAHQHGGSSVGVCVDLSYGNLIARYRLVGETVYSGAFELARAEDENLETTSKSLVGAINELKARLDELVPAENEEF